MNSLLVGQRGSLKTYMGSHACLNDCVIHHLNEKYKFQTMAENTTRDCGEFEVMVCVCV